jgi:biotin-(acetyl-CoA carboxylase) ligase
LCANWPRAVFSVILLCLAVALYKLSANASEESIILRGIKLPEATEFKPNICVDDIVVEWLFTKMPMDLSKASIFQNSRTESAATNAIYDALTSKRWLLASCETAKNNGANGLDREWKGDIPGNINADLFITASVVGNDAKLLRNLLHRIIPFAIYRIIQREIAAGGGKAENVKLKWVNDVLVNGKKICGVKPDDFGSNDRAVSYQFGVNVNMPEKELAKIDQPATSLSVELGRAMDHERILREIVEEIVKLVQYYKDNLPALDDEFSSHMAFIGEEVIVYDYVPGKNIEGILDRVSGGKIYIRDPITNKVTGILPGFGLLRKKR